MKFNYQARTKNGDLKAGQVEASSKDAAADVVSQYGLYITFLEEEFSPFYAKKLSIFERISRQDIVLFSRQLAIMFKAKVPLMESLRVLAAQTQNQSFKEKIMRLSEDVEGGTRFSKALSNFPNAFSPFYVAVVKSGEASGSLADALDYLAEHLEREYHLMAKTKGALIYPMLIVFVVISVLALMIFFVIPNLSAVLLQNNTPLPAPTRFVIGMSAFFRAWGILLIIFIAFLSFGIWRYSLTKKGKKLFDVIFLRLPLIGSLLKMIYVSRFAENLSTLISAGLPINQALETVSEIIGSVSYKEAISDINENVKKGSPISGVLSKYQNLFPPIFVQMALVGERTGTLDKTLMNIVNFYQKEIDGSIDNVLSIMEPLLIVVLGAIVAGIMLAILLPMYQTISV